MNRTRKEMAVFVIESIKELGVRLSSESRLMKMHRILTDGSGYIPPTHPEFEIVVESTRDMQLLQYIFDNKPTRPDHPIIKQLLTLLTKDSVLPQNDSNNSKGRDTQFELFIAAICQAAGFKSVDFQEPDVTCEVQEIKVGLAAKRFKKIKQVKKHIPKAADQINKSGFMGFIVLDTSIALNPENERFIMPIPDEEFAKRHRLAIKDFFDKYNTRIKAWVSDQNVLGVIVHDNQVKCDVDRDWSLSGMTMPYCTTEDNEKRRVFDLFINRYLAALPNMQYL